MTNLKVIVSLVAVLTIASVTSLPHVIGQGSTDVPATARICGIDVQLFTLALDQRTFVSLPSSTTGFNFGTLEHGDISDKRVLYFQAVDNNPATLRIFASDWNDFDGNFVMNGTQTHTTPRITDTYAQAFPLNSTGQYTPAGVGNRALPTGSINADRDGVILPTLSSGNFHLAILSVEIDTSVDGQANTDFQGSIHQDVTLQIEC